MSRQLIAAGNWKMNTDFNSGMDLAGEIRANTTPGGGILTILAPPTVFLKPIADLVADASHIQVAAQNCHQEEKGAFTGEVSVAMLRSIGVEYVILGHSERRQYFGEDNALLAQKVDRVLGAGLRPIFCCGESLATRESGRHTAFVAQQLEESLFHLSAADFAPVIIAYEPIWAIGTGVTASKEQAQEMHREIRDLLARQYGAATAEQSSILYGGSVKPANARDLFAQPDVDGGLVGGASLKATDFVAIIQAFA